MRNYIQRRLERGRAIIYLRVTRQIQQNFSKAHNFGWKATTIVAKKYKTTAHYNRELYIETKQRHYESLYNSKKCCECYDQH